MAVDDKSPIASQAEISAALAEAERESDIPNLDDGQTVVPVPVPVQADTESAPRVDTRASFDASVVATVAAPTEPAPPAAAKPPPATGVLGWLRRLGDWAYIAADKTLWAVNVPFTWMSAGVRQTVAALAITMIAVSLLAAFLFPFLFPHRTAVSDLQQKCAVVLEPPASETDAEAE